MLIDDIATLLDDVALMTKTATQKTAGVLGDDLALNAEQVTGVSAERELPVIWAVAKGSMLNKAILVPAALLISAFAPWAIQPMLMIGGGFLCYEGFEKVLHKVLHAKEEKPERTERLKAIQNTEVDMVAFEKDKIKGAIRTDFILSAEIIVITLGTFSAEQPMTTRIVALCVIAISITVFVYGLVAGIVKIDDLGRHLIKKGGAAASLGKLLLNGAPYLMKGLGIAGTIAMFLVGGGIIAHGIPQLAHIAHAIEKMAAPMSTVGPTLFSFIVGIISGGIILAVITGINKLRPAKPDQAKEA